MNRLPSVCLVLILAAAALHAQEAAKKILLPMRISFQEAWFVDAAGAAVGSARYLDAAEYREGLAAVQVDGKGWGFIDAEGRFVVQPRYYDAGSFHDGLAAVKTGKDGLWGYIDATGRTVIPARYRLAYSFQEGFARVWTGEESQLIDRTGHALPIPAPWKPAGQEGFSEGFAPVQADGLRAGFADASGKIAFVLADCSDAREFHEGLAVVRMGEKYGYVDKGGKPAIPALYDEARGFHGKRAAVRIGKKWGFIDPKGQTAVDAAWDGCGDFSEGLAPVAIGGTEMLEAGSWRYVDAGGKTVITPAFSFAGPFRDGFAEVAVGDPLRQEYFYIDKKGIPLRGLPGFLVDARTDFSAEKNTLGFTSEGSWKAEKGVYSYTGKGEGAETLWTSLLVPPDFHAEAKVVAMSGRDPAAGIVFRVDEKGETFYWFGLRKDGSCAAYYAARDGKWETMDQGRVKAKAGANTLQVVCRGDTAYCYLNGAKALTFRDSRIGGSYRHIGFYVETATAVSFDDLAVRAIGREEAVAGFDLEPTMEDLGSRLQTQISTFPDSALKLLVPQDPKSPGELYLSFEGLGAGAYLIKKPGWAADPLEFSFIGQPLFKAVGKYGLQFPEKMPPLKEGAVGAYDEPTAYSPRIYLPLLASPGTNPLAPLLRDWRSLSVELLEAERRIRSENQWEAFGDPMGIAVGVIDLAGIVSALVGLIDWGISGAFGERQSLEVWGGLGAIAAANLLYLPIGFLVIDPICDGIVDSKLKEERRRYDEKFRALADSMRGKFPEDILEGRPRGE